MLDTQDITERLGAMKAAVAYAKLWAAAWQQCRQAEDAQAHERKVSSFVERLDEAFTQAERKAQEAQEQAKNIVTQAANIAGKIDGFMQTLSTYTPGTTKTNRACVTDDGNQGTLGSGSARGWEYTAFNECRSPPSTADYAALVDKATTTSTQIHKAAANKAIGSTCSIFRQTRTTRRINKHVRNPGNGRRLGRPLARRAKDREWHRNQREGKR
ncbi:hypothetical protein ERJ75_000780200 [Trypanosoma vivax]|nr:hypothetical protein ERJ75_000780200 [Trypanosoma vivax]